MNRPDETNEKPLQENCNADNVAHFSSKLPVPGGSAVKNMTSQSRTSKRKVTTEEEVGDIQMGCARKRARLDVSGTHGSANNSIVSSISERAVFRAGVNVPPVAATRTAAGRKPLSRQVSNVKDKGRNPGFSTSKSVASFKVPQAVASDTKTSAETSFKVPAGKGKPVIPERPAVAGKKRPAWDTKGRLEDMEELFSKQRQQNNSLQEQILSSSDRITLLESMNNQLSGTIKETEQQKNEASGEIYTLQRKLRENENEFEDFRSKSKRQMDDLEIAKSSLERQKIHLDGELAAAQEELKGLKVTVSQMSSSQAGLESQLSTLKMSLEKSQIVISDKSEEIATLKATIAGNLQTIAEANARIRNEESYRRKLHNTILELKGNVRVFCRVRPLLKDEAVGNNGEIAHMHFPDDERKILELDRLADGNPNESVVALKKGIPTKFEFTFDHVFPPHSSQGEVFEEISQLVQSALDGYNVCIFAYGQTGSGKTYTMEGLRNSSSEDRGMIPRAVEQVFQTADVMAEKGWQYEFEVCFLEIYNETIRDLLNNNKDEIKHEIRLANANSNEVYVSDLTITKVENEHQTNDLLRKAMHNRSVAETKCNERSSRSHSVFRMKITGKNSHTLEACCGLLNLIDLAGSERLKESGSTGQRLKETVSINKSLANLGNVILALANKESHVPYRNSKLTHLLQNCLGGSSKTLMFVNVSPKEECFQETVNSLRFATKVNECNIGTAQKKVKQSV